jgi:hypothetical protein
MMEKSFVVLLFFCSQMFSQNIELSTCKKDLEFSAYNRNMMYEALSIYRFEDTFKYYILDTVFNFQGISFNKVPTRGNDNKKFHLLAEGRNNELYWLDTIEYKVKILIPSEEIEGYELKNVLGLDYKIVGYHVKIETPVCKYNDALMFLTKNTFLDNYEAGEVFYYVRGIGFVASEYRGIIESYITRRYILDKKGNR